MNASRAGASNTPPMPAGRNTAQSLPPRISCASTRCVFRTATFPRVPADVAVLAVKAYEVFLKGPASDAEAAAGIVAACRSFDQQPAGD